MYSIRNRLNYTIVIGMVVVLLLAAVFLYARVSAQVEKVFDTSLLDKAQAMISLTELDDEGLEFDFAEEGVMLEFAGGDQPQYYQLWDEDGNVLSRSPLLEDANLPRTGIAAGQHRFADLRLPDGRSGRLIEIGFMPRVEGDKWEPEEEEDDGKWGEKPVAQPVTLVFARERISLNDTLLVIGATIGGTIVVVLLLSALLIRRLVGSGLAPLSNLARQVGRIDESRLDSRLTREGEQSVEIAPIENQLNHLLERLNSAFEREKRFSANVSHELRTPLSELRALAEVGRMVPDDSEQVTGFFNDVGEISSQMEKVVITLLELTRSEAGLLRSDPEDIELASFCDEVWNHAVNGQRGNKTLIKRIPEDLVINTDRDKLGMILGNLLTNAVSYSPEDAEIRVTTRIVDDKVVLEVKNASVDLKPEDVLHMKDRFWRKHKAHHGSGHSGLGLTLVDALARIMKLDVNLQLDHRQIFMVTISGLQVSLHR
jgi:signal transduction histidine kinase